MIALIAAVADNGIIGAGGKLPWHLPEDLKKFKELTTGKVVIMGRKTYESIIAMLGKPLPNRQNVVITRNTEYKGPSFTKVSESEVPQVQVFYDVHSALEANKSNDIFIIGGGEIYKQALEVADTMYITHVHESHEGDTHFPKVNMSDWEKTGEDSRDGFTFAIYNRK